MTIIRTVLLAATICSIFLASPPSAENTLTTVPHSATIVEVKDLKTGTYFAFDCKSCPGENPVTVFMPNDLGVSPDQMLGRKVILHLDPYAEGFKLFDIEWETNS